MKKGIELGISAKMNRPLKLITSIPTLLHVRIRSSNSNLFGTSTDFNVDLCAGQNFSIVWSEHVISPAESNVKPSPLGFLATTL